MNCLSDDQLIDRLYGIAPEDAEHLDCCKECQTRMGAMRARQELTLVASPTTVELHRQRRAIQQRLAEPAKRRWAPILVPATAAGLAIAGIAFRDTTPANSASRLKTVVAQDAGWFEDSYAAMSGLEPRAASPMRALFDEPVLE